MSKFKAIYDEKNAAIPVKYNIEPWATIGEFFEYLETRVDDEIIARVLVLNRRDTFDHIGYVTYRNGKRANTSTLLDFFGCKIIMIEGTKKGNREIVRILAF